MNALIHPRSPCARQRGVGLIEMMVGILIGMIVILVVFNILSVAEGYKRTALGTSDAQITGLLSQFVAGRDAGNGGAGITMSTGSAKVPADLSKCIRNDALANVSTIPVTDLDAAVRPIPVLITDGGNAGTSDSFIAMNAGSSHVMWPVDFRADAAPGAPIVVQSPNGFTVPPPTVAAPYWVVVMTNDGTGTCKMLRVTAAVPEPPPVPPAKETGQVTLTQDGATATTVNYEFRYPARLLNLGPQGTATRVRYDVDAANSVLRTTDLLTTNALAPNPVAQNVVLLKAQYGVDNTGDGVVDCWTPADNSTPCGDFSVATMRAPAANLNQIIAVRIGVVVRSDEPDLRLLTDPTNTTLQAEARALLSATRPPVILFNCSTNTNAACQSRIVVPMGGTATGAPVCAPAVVCDYWRYRTYETVIPLRNAIYSASTP